MDPVPAGGGVPFSLESFTKWYELHSERFLHPALASARKALREILTQELSPRERVRIDVRPGRVKSHLRAWQKLNKKYADRVVAPEDVPGVMDDLVGLRVVCTNRSDLRRVQDIIDNLDVWAGEEMPPVLGVHGGDSERNYLDHPKPSGYRAYHVNLCTTVTHAAMRYPVVCELQVRTLLQDSWGELTHEDTYKPGGASDPLVKTLSRRMSDLMATIDDMAEDLRGALERIAASAADPSSGDEAPTLLADARDAGSDAAVQFLHERIGRLVFPLDWASLAWEMQREFGQDVVSGWFGYGTFKDLMLAAVPAEQVIAESPGYVLPADFDIDAYDFGSSTDVPRSVRLLHETDKTFPVGSPETWREAYRALAAASESESAERPVVKDLTKQARDRARQQGIHVTRRQLDHIARTLESVGELAPNMRADAIGVTFREVTVARARPFCSSPDDVAELEAWLAGSDG